MLPRHGGSSDEVARSVSRLISRWTMNWMTNASSTTNSTCSSRCTGPAKKFLVSEAAWPSWDTFQTSRQASPGLPPQLPTSVSGTLSAPKIDTWTCPNTTNLL